MISRFLKDRRGNYAMMMGVAMLPIMGSLAIAVDFSEMNRQKQATINALDAAGIATARQVAAGASDAALIAYANDFFKANLGSVDPDDTELTVVLPNNLSGGGTLKLTAVLDYQPYFLPVFTSLLGKDEGASEISFAAKSEIRLKNTLEVALVLDNSTSMDLYGSGSGLKRMALLKIAAKQLVDTLALQAAQIKQVDKPVQFSLVPFAASVNVGPQNAGAAWMDAKGLSPVHHENFDWSTLADPTKYAEKVGGIWYKKGEGWGAEEGQLLSRFSLYRDMKVVTSHERVAGSRRVVCDEYNRHHACTDDHYEYDYIDTYGPFASWQGCVEARPSPYNVDDTPASGGTADTGFGDPATMFVPMFAPDEPGNHWKVTQDPDEENPKTYGAANSWWNDDPSSSTGATRQRNMAKYFMPRAINAPVLSVGRGPNYSCTTTPITPLTDVTTEAGLATIKTAIDQMAANGYTDVPEGTAWGWRTISSTAPFTEGRPESEKGNDKVVIVLTDGANTYSAPNSDPAGNKSTYAAYGYTGLGYNGTGSTRLFKGTSSAIGQYDYSGSNYSAALNEHMTKLCDNAKAGNIIMMTVSLDLSTSNTEENKAIEALKKCASDSRFRKDATGKPEKLFWNASGSNLAETFKKIGDELSNLRIVG
jgi:Flp pilus assembly protein TadG